MANWTLEQHVNNWVKTQLEHIGLKSIADFNVESAMSEYLKKALQGGSKTAKKTSFGKPDFNIEKYEVPVIIENKLDPKKFKAEKDGKIKFDDVSISSYAVNGVLHYARCIIDSPQQYHEVIAIAVTGNTEEAVHIGVYYVHGSSENAVKFLANVKTFDFLENEKTFNAFLDDARLTEKEKHRLLIDSKATLWAKTKLLNKLMHNHNITASQRVLYVSGMLLAMQDITDKDGNILQGGQTPERLTGIQTESNRDGIIIFNHIKEFLAVKNIETDKQTLMLASFAEISKDKQRDIPEGLDKIIAPLLKEKASCNKQIFTFIYEHVFKAVDIVAGDIDIMGEMYSEFLKYALGDGKELGIVLTPVYVTKMMTELLNINKESRVMDLAAGSAGFLISAMQLMQKDAEKAYGKKSTKTEEKTKAIKKHQLLGVELNAEMYTLAATNMILRGDGSSNIKKENTFNTTEDLYNSFKPNRILLNPPFSYDENGMPFIEFGLNKMEKGSLGAIIIQDSAGSGKAVRTNSKILQNHTLLASIKMPTDLFQPMAGVQTSIYVFEAQNPHDFEKTVRFIDFRNDGYKRTSRSLQEIDSPIQRYEDIIKIYKAGTKAQVHHGLWKLDEICVDDFITDSGNDWNFDQHRKIDTAPKLEDFKKTVSDYLAWEVSEILKNKESCPGKQQAPV